MDLKFAQDSPVLQITDLSFAYDDRQALDGVSLAVRPGEMLGVIGPNGSGKSTLLRTVSGVLRPYSGHVAVDGQDIAAISRAELARRVAVVPQNPSLPESFTAREIVILGRTPHLRLLQSEGPRDFAVVRRAMEACGVWELAERRVGELSGGERQRVVIARALAQEPRLLMLDEPTSHLDISHQTTILDLVASLVREQGLAVLVVFHDLNLAAQYCHRLVILRMGRVLAAGPPEKVITAETVSTAYAAQVCIVPHPHNNLPAALVVGGNHLAAGAHRPSATHGGNGFRPAAGARQSRVSHRHNGNHQNSRNRRSGGK